MLTISYMTGTTNEQSGHCNITASGLTNRSWDIVNCSFGWCPGTAGTLVPSITRLRPNWYRAPGEWPRFVIEVAVRIFPAHIKSDFLQRWTGRGRTAIELELF